MDIDSAFKSFSSVKSDVDGNLKNIETEEDAKIQIIIRVLTEVLGWKHSNIAAERKHSNGFSDLLISQGEQEAFLVEAKRIGVLSIDTQENQKVRHFKLSGPALKDIEDGIDQATSYAAPNGISVAVLTDGIKWIVFKTFIPGDNFKSHKAFVFPSLDAIQNNFSVFYELLSKGCFGKKIYGVHFDELHNNRLLLSQSLKAPISENEIKLEKKSTIAFDLEQVFAAFFNRLTGDHDDDLLVDCFVETRESRIADFSLEKITANVLGNIDPQNKDVNRELKALIQNAVSVENGQTVFVVGPTGAGKTTFLERFFKKTLSKGLRDECVVLNINSLDSSGREDTILQWLTETLIGQLEQQLFKDGNPTWEELRGLYFEEYKRRSVGADAGLYKSDKTAFYAKFSEYLDDKVEREREGYLRRILSDTVCNRKKLPIILIDNTDEFSSDYKKEVFQFCQSLRREVNHCILIFPITDKSAWSFSKTDLYSIYRSKSFFLPTPPPREVFRKRIDFIREKMQGEVPEKEKRQYLANKGIKISIENLCNFASIVEDVFVDHEYTSKMIGEISNYNIRKTLELSQRVITSSVYAISDLLAAFVAGKTSMLNYAKFMNALLKGDYELLKISDNSFVLPLFQVSEKVKQSPLLSLRILSLLDVTKNAARTAEDSYLSIESIYTYFDTLGCYEAALDDALLVLLEAGLIEPYDPSVQDLSVNQKFSISFSGSQHLKLGQFNNIFFEQMALITAITNSDVASEMRGIYLSDIGYQDRMKKIREIFAKYLLEEDSIHLSVPQVGDQFMCQHQLTESIEKFSHPYSEEDRKFETFLQECEIGTGVLATVDWYNKEKGFGFTDIDICESQAFLHSSILVESKIECVFDGDKLLCDIAQNNKGVFIKKIHDVETKERDIENVKAVVVRIFPERSYGFMEIDDGTRSAFFHFDTIEEKLLKTLDVGCELNVEISSNKNGDGYQVRKVIS